eukprot:720571-Amphidinium_carterae.1
MALYWMSRPRYRILLSSALPRLYGWGFEDGRRWATPGWAGVVHRCCRASRPAGTAPRPPLTLGLWLFPGWAGMSPQNLLVPWEAAPRFGRELPGRAGVARRRR